MEINSSYFSYLFAFGFGQSLLLTAALLKSSQRRSITRIFFLMVLIIMAVEILYGLLYQTQSIFDFPHLLRINTFLVMSFGPALYLALYYYYKSEINFGRRDLLHFIPALITLLYFIPLFSANSSTKIDYLNMMYEGVHTDSLIFGGARRLQQGVYLFFVIRLLWINKQDFQDNLKNNYFRPLLAMILLFGFMWLGDIYRYFFRFDLYTGIINTILMSAVLVYLTIKFISRESFFDGNSDRKYASSGLSKSQEKEILTKVKQIFLDESLFTDSSLSLQSLSTALQIPANYISQSINNQLGLSYSDFIGQWRVNKAKDLLQDQSNHRLTLEFIGKQAGFKSTSAFNASFRKNTGTTPSQYRKQFE
ncbi:hypothetical protein BFP97_18515 [Roseivirga sp. 4D4]|uniref:AraC family transcriptional regulator n=1 Tax=Roseivirga sp. 4D4 TaxID=1889784 RepID=UPI000853EC78|nr:helix-turn-helix domain-containing protein [Roseivirga sp. 4D4]OEK03393.1 hypothetical protein BFP97_18515 [Roseivirga sp. 4D4]